MGKWKHRLNNKNINNLTAICVICGPVKIYLKDKNKKTYTCSLLKKSNNLGINIEDIINNPIKQSCEICNSKNNLCLDHEHITGRVRGTLCKNCNLALGYFKDNKVFLKKAINYL